MYERDHHSKAVIIKYNRDIDVQARGGELPDLIWGDQTRLVEVIIPSRNLKELVLAKPKKQWREGYSGQRNIVSNILETAAKG